MPIQAEAIPGAPCQTNPRVKCEGHGAVHASMLHTTGSRGPVPKVMQVSARYRPGGTAASSFVLPSFPGDMDPNRAFGSRLDSLAGVPFASTRSSRIKISSDPGIRTDNAK